MEKRALPKNYEAISKNIFNELGYRKTKFLNLSLRNAAGRWIQLVRKMPTQWIHWLMIG